MRKYFYVGGFILILVLILIGLYIQPEMIVKIEEITPTIICYGASC